MRNRNKAKESVMSVLHNVGFNDSLIARTLGVAKSTVSLWREREGRHSNGRHGGDRKSARYRLSVG